MYTIIEIISEKNKVANGKYVIDFSYGEYDYTIEDIAAFFEVEIKDISFIRFFCTLKYNDPCLSYPFVIVSHNGELFFE